MMVAKTGWEQMRLSPLPLERRQQSRFHHFTLTTLYQFLCKQVTE